MPVDLESEYVLRAEVSGQNASFVYNLGSGFEGWIKWENKESEEYHICTSEQSLTLFVSLWGYFDLSINKPTKFLFLVQSSQF